MRSWAEAIVGLWLLVAPNGDELLQALAGASLAQAIPQSRFEDFVPDLYLVYHQESDWPLAFAAGPDEIAAKADLVTRLTRSGSRLLPGLALPRLFLHAPTFRPSGRLRSVQTLAVDEADALFRALMQVLAERRLEEFPPLAEELRRMAEARMTGVPAGQRVAAYLSAWVELSAHALTVAQQVARADARSVDRGAHCPALRQGVALFGLWGQIFGAGAYHGHYWLEDSQGGEWQMSKASLQAVDKAFLMREILGDYWRGEAVEDFAWLCVSQVATPR